MPKKKYIYERVEESKLQDWLNERAAEGYVLEDSWMITRRMGRVMFAVLMRLAVTE